MVLSMVYGIWEIFLLGHVGNEAILDHLYCIFKLMCDDHKTAFDVLEQCQYIFSLIQNLFAISVVNDQHIAVVLVHY